MTMTVLGVEEDVRHPTSDLHWFARLLAPVIGAYLLFDRAAAYVHIPGTPAFIGEVLLVIGLAGAFRARGYLRQALRDDALLSVAMGFFLWGVVRGAANLGGFGLTWLARDSALWYYVLFSVLAATLLLARPSTPGILTRQLNRFIPYLLLWLPVAVVLSPAGTKQAAFGSSIHVPFSAVSVFSHKDGNVAVAAVMALAALWLLPSDRRSARSRNLWSLLAIADLLVAGTQNRGGFLAGATAIGIGLLLNRQLARKALTGVVVIALVVSAYSVLQPHLGTHSARSVTSTQLVANAESIVGIKQTASLQGTERAREIQWSYIVNRESAEGRLWYGWGPGMSLGFGLTTGIGDASLRAAHNSHLDVLARLGLVGLGLWILMWVAWFWRMLIGRRRLDGVGRHLERRLVDFCVITCSAILVNAFFDPSLEGPQVAVLLWTLFGVGAVLTNPRWSGRFHGRPGLMEPAG